MKKKDPHYQLEASKLSIKDLLGDLLNETRGLKYQITVKVLLKNYKPNGEIEFAPLYFNSTTKTICVRPKPRIKMYFFYYQYVQMNSCLLQKLLHFYHLQ